VRQVHGRVPVIGGTGSNSTFFTRDLALEAEKTGIDAHLIVTPYYNKTSQDGLIRHYSYLSDVLTKPIIIYNVPSRTGMNITPETYQILSERKNIVAVKEADPNVSKLIKSVSLCGNNLDFYIGNDDLISVSSYVGCKGVISVLSNILPSFTQRLTHSALNNETDKANSMQAQCLELIDAIFSEVNPIPIKEAMKILGYDTGYLRGPLSGLSAEKIIKLNTILNKHRDLIEAENIKDFI
jgi:4-hydroxy-tetrahydrodipicolinate synthase